LSDLLFIFFSREPSLSEYYQNGKRNSIFSEKKSWPQCSFGPVTDRHDDIAAEYYDPWAEASGIAILFGFWYK
jgi:hypothetical protein